MATTTQDIGLAIRNFIEDQEIETWTDADLESGTTDGRDHIDFVDCSDSSNLIVHTESGRAFTVRVLYLGG